MPAGAAVAVVGEQTVLAPTVVAARPRRRRRWRRRLLAVAAIMDVVGRLHVTVTTCRPAAWPNTTRAFKPLARQRSYNAEKSALETSGCGVGQTGPSTHAHTSPLTTFTHVGKTREVGGDEKLEMAGSQPAWLVRLRPQRGRRGGGRGEMTAKLLSRCTPQPQWGRGDRWKAGVRVQVKNKLRVP